MKYIFDKLTIVMQQLQFSQIFRCKNYNRFKPESSADFFGCFNTRKTITMRLTVPTKVIIDCVSQKKNTLQNTGNKRIINVLPKFALSWLHFKVVKMENVDIAVEFCM
jgi:hypothetical protein